MLLNVTLPQKDIVAIPLACLNILLGFLKLNTTNKNNHVIVTLLLRFYECEVYDKKRSVQ